VQVGAAVCARRRCCEHANSDERTCPGSAAAATLLSQWGGACISRQGSKLQRKQAWCRLYLGLASPFRGFSGLPLRWIDRRCTEGRQGPRLALVGGGSRIANVDVIRVERPRSFLHWPLGGLLGLRAAGESAVAREAAHTGGRRVHTSERLREVCAVTARRGRNASHSRNVRRRLRSFLCMRVGQKARGSPRGPGCRASTLGAMACWPRQQRACSSAPSPERTLCGLLADDEGVELQRHACCALLSVALLLCIHGPQPRQSQPGSSQTKPMTLAEHGPVDNCR
jgi:hypothetical protein